jgi:hypothetical protein
MEKYWRYNGDVMEIEWRSYIGCIIDYHGIFPEYSWDIMEYGLIHVNTIL